VNKTQLADVIAEKVGSKKLAAEVIDDLLKAIQDAVAQGDKVALPGFGIFMAVERPARIARNPATDQRIEIPALRVPKFKVGSKFKTAVENTAQ